MTTEQIDAVDDARRATVTREGGYWLAYYTDWSGFVAFGDELACLRHAIEHSMAASWVPFGVDPRDHVNGRA